MYTKVYIVRRYSWDDGKPRLLDDKSIKLMTVSVTITAAVVSIMTIDCSMTTPAQSLIIRVCTIAKLNCNVRDYYLG